MKWMKFLIEPKDWEQFLSHSDVKHLDWFIREVDVWYMLEKDEEPHLWVTFPMRNKAQFFARLSEKQMFCLSICSWQWETYTPSDDDPDDPDDGEEIPSDCKLRLAS